MDHARRAWLRTSLLGASAFGLRSLTSGLPVAWLMDPTRALAQSRDPAACERILNAQFLVLSASERGDPINANVPGSFGDPRFFHSTDPRMVRTALTLGSLQTEAAKPWADLPAPVLARTLFFHHATQTNAHPNHEKVMSLLGQTRRQEMIASIYAKYLAPCLGTVQREPVAVGAVSSGELLKFEGRSLPQLSPRGLRTLLGSTPGALTQLRAARDRDLDAMNALFKQHATAEQQAFLDRLARSQQEARAIPEALLDSLSSITANDVAGQIRAAAALISMKVCPVVSIHIPFGGDNHVDLALANETEQTVAGTAGIAALVQNLTELGVADQTTFALLNVFGRTLVTNEQADADNGRTHNPNHGASVLIGRGVRPGVVGGAEVSGREAVAVAFDSSTGLPSAQGDITRDVSLGSFAKTLGACLGVPEAGLDEDILSGQVVRSAVARAS